MLKPIALLLQEATQNAQLVTARQASVELKSNHGLLIDVREPEEHKADPAAGAINIPRGILEPKILQLETDPERPIYLHCASSLRAALAAEQLTRIGYKNVKVITCKMEEIRSACLS
ncbi:rhodanese-like domain-containing protein [Aliiglaciecola sp. LCG003]|uniref:rhodanese-like domain-containing protein n=1 Tax=Aliiglaciecola sp. LCG003 TaxID=3053655 RepID=UPI002573C2F2|nr:rhodanese-like domain-containing protein [Aliiglaciecola sp. LCG003]WJG07684.1 rhodanese-like domain-containing protein [Aliiglaciecola sp. LCG003]